jgi:hypothetical protein
VFTDRVELSVRPREGHAPRAARHPERAVPHQPGGRGTDIGAALEHLERVSKRRSVVFVVSDFLDPARAWRSASRRGATT